MLSKGKTAMRFSSGTDLLVGWLSRNAARSDKKNQAIATAATHKPEPTTHRIVRFSGFAFGDFAATGSPVDFSSSAVKAVREAIASLTLAVACCNWPGV